MPFRDATALSAAVAAGEVASQELLDLYLDRIERLNGPLNAVVTLDADRAREAAAAADKAQAAGQLLGPLHGLPVTIKDAIETAGIRSTGGAVELRDHVPEQDAPAVARLKDAGAVVFGKTNVPRWSGDGQTFNEIFGTTNNPWDTSRVPGGSSGGPAAAVAAGFTSFEVGTDIGGSIRLPSHFCGVYGLKPSFGIVPQRGYLDRVGGGVTDADINVFGPIARSARDLDLLLSVLAGPPPELEAAWRLQLPAPRRTELADLRVAVWFDEDACPVGRDERALLQSLADRLADAGAKVEEAHPDISFPEQVGMFNVMVSAAMAPSMDEPALAEAFAGNHLGWLEMEVERARLRSRWAEWFAECDVLLCPVSPSAAFPHNQEGHMLERTLTIDGVDRSYLDTFAWNGMIGITGHPSAVIPVGRTDENLPVGVQIVAGYLRDREATHAAQLFADVVGGFEPPPGF